MSDVDLDQDELAAGRVALERAAWLDAKTAFEQALQRRETPEAHDGLGIALWWLNEIADSHHHRALAYTGFKERGEAGKAAWIASWMAREQVFLSSNVPAMHGWFARAEYLLQQVNEPLARAWCHILRASVMALPIHMPSVAEEVIATARQEASTGLEAFAMAYYGQSLITVGRVAEGMSRLDEAMTMILSGEVRDYVASCEVFCVMLSACEVAGDLTRSDLWCRAAAEFAERYQCPYLSAYCRTAYGGLLTAMGRWQDAEVALMEAISAFERGHRGLRVHAVIKLADLRVSQGKIEEAEVLLEGLEDQAAAVIPLTRLYVQKGQFALATSVLQQAIPLSKTDYTLHHLPSLLLQIEILLQTGQADATHDWLVTVESIIGQTNSALLEARLELTRGQIRTLLGHTGEAKDCLSRALALLQSWEQSFLAAQVRLQMAYTLQESDPIGAIAWAKAALATFERIGATQQTGKAAKLLRELGAGRSRSNKSIASVELTIRESEIVTLITNGLTNREIADRLVISSKTVEHHVSHILQKLNLKTRAEVAAFSASGKLRSTVKKTGRQDRG